MVKLMDKEGDFVNIDNIKKFIDEQMDKKETVNSYLLKSIALIKVALTNDFFEYDEETQHNYLWTVRDLLIDAEELNEQQISDCFKYLDDFK